MLRSFHLSVICVCLALIGCGSSTQAGHPTDPKAFALRLSDVPRGFVLDSARYWRNKQAASRDHLPVSAYDSHGRIRSYENTFTPSLALDEPPTGGLQRAASEVVEYQDTRGAHWDWLRMRNVWRHATAMGSTTLGANAGEAGRPVPFKAIAAPRVGDESAAFSVTWGGDEFAYTTTVVVFRRGKYVATATAIGIVDQVPPRRAVSMARTVDRRIALSR